MNRYFTPNQIVGQINNCIPSEIGSLLEPSVGCGALLAPFTRKSIHIKNKIVCLDTDNSNLANVDDKYRTVFGEKLYIINDDFINWSIPEKRENEVKYDCIVMNPPFRGTKSNLLAIDVRKELGYGKKRVIAIELAFFIRAIQLLEEQGTLVAVMPFSFVISKTAEWLREIILKIGTIEKTIEFPRLTFKGVEAKTFLIVFRKGIKKKGIYLYRYPGTKPLYISREKKNVNDLRFDFSYYDSRKAYESIIKKTRNLEWANVGDLADIHRGVVNTPFNGTRAIHTTDYENGLWRIIDKSKNYLRNYDYQSIRTNDIIVKRVSRNCSKSFGLAKDLNGYACSDCLLIIRPKIGKMFIPILLSLRLVAQKVEIKNILENGSGAKYITMEGLYRLPIPIGIAIENTEILEKYHKALEDAEVSIINEIETKLKEKYYF